MEQFSFRNASADALREVLRDLSEEQRTVALWHVAYSLREHNSDPSRSSFQGRILSSASFFRDDHTLLLPLVLKLCESSDLLLRVDAACTTLFLNRETEDLVTDIVVTALVNRMQLRDAPPLKIDENTAAVQKAGTESKAEAELEYQWQRFGIAHFLDHHYGIKIDMSEEMHQVHIFLDQVQERFDQRINDIVRRFEEDMDALAQRTSDFLSTYFRSSLVGMAGAPLPLLSETNQQKILDQFLAIIVQPAEASIVKIRALDHIPRATVPLDDAVAPLLQSAIMTAHQEIPELRVEVYETLGQLKDL